MRKTITLTKDQILNMDLTQSWQITPFMTGSLHEQKIEDVEFTEDGNYGTLNYEVLVIEKPQVAQETTPRQRQVKVEMVGYMVDQVVVEVHH